MALILQPSLSMKKLPKRVKEIVCPKGLLLPKNLVAVSVVTTILLGAVNAVAGFPVESVNPNTSKKPGSVKAVFIAISFLPVEAKPAVALYNLTDFSIKL